MAEAHLEVLEAMVYPGSKDGMVARPLGHSLDNQLQTVYSIVEPVSLPGHVVILLRIKGALPDHEKAVMLTRCALLGKGDSCMSIVHASSHRMSLDKSESNSGITMF
jgi:hypothetical protein